MVWSFIISNSAIRTIKIRKVQKDTIYITQSGLEEKRQNDDRNDY